MEIIIEVVQEESTLNRWRLRKVDTGFRFQKIGSESRVYLLTEAMENIAKGIEMQVPEATSGRMTVGTKRRCMTRGLPLHPHLGLEGLLITRAQEMIYQICKR